MQDRIKKIMEDMQLSPSAFADRLQVGRAVISHILNGRNNPSLDIVMRILDKIDNINSDWLLSGIGEMYKSDYKNISQPSYGSNQNFNSQLRASEPDLFSQNPISPYNEPKTNEYRKENIVEQPKSVPENIVYKEVIPQKAVERKVNKIIIYYTDNTFEIFNTDNRPL